MDAAAFAEMDKVRQTLLIETARVMNGYLCMKKNMKLENSQFYFFFRLSFIPDSLTGSSEAADITDHSTTWNGADKSQRKHKTVSQTYNAICMRM